VADLLAVNANMNSPDFEMLMNQRLYGHSAPIPGCPTDLWASGRSVELSQGGMTLHEIGAFVGNSPLPALP